MNRLRHFQVVTISPPPEHKGSRDFQAYLLAIDGPVAALHPVRRADALWLPEQMDDVLLSFMHGRQPVALRGTLRSGAGFEDLRFRCDSAHIPARRSSRLRLCAPIRLVPVADDGCQVGEPLELQTRDVGPDGVTLEPPASLSPGARVDVELTLPEHDVPVAAIAVIAVIGDDGALAASFVDLDPAERARLRKFVVSALRRRLKMLLRVEGDDAW